MLPIRSVVDGSTIGLRIPTSRSDDETGDGKVQRHENSSKVRRHPRINPQPFQPRPPPQPPRHLQTEPRCRTRGMASACSLNASDQHPSQARLGLSENADWRHHFIGFSRLFKTILLPSIYHLYTIQKGWRGLANGRRNSQAPRSSKRNRKNHNQPGLRRPRAHRFAVAGRLLFSA